MTPTLTANPVTRSEKITNGYPRLAMVVRDPSTSARLIGLFGGRLFQVSATLPTTIERIRPTGMSGAELVEFVAQAINAQVVPLPTGYVQLVGRAQPTGAPTAISVDRVKILQRRISENFFSVVRVSGMPQDVYQDAYGATNGGTALEISNQPCIWSDGGAYALASIYASFFGVPRRKEIHTWFYDDANAAPPWESLMPWTVITVNGSAKNWLYTGLSYDLVKGEAEVTLLEQV
jgi:hypothetical protein